MFLAPHTFLRARKMTLWAMSLIGIYVFFS
jgi:hypothetical protein